MLLSHLNSVNDKTRIVRLFYFQTPINKNEIKFEFKFKYIELNNDSKSDRYYHIS